MGKNKEGSHRTYNLVISALAMLASSSAFAGSVEQEIIEKSLNAYGGKALLELNSLTYKDKMKHFFEMQSGHQMQGAMTSHLNEYKIETKIDFEQGQIEFKRLANRLVGNHGSHNMTAVHRLYSNAQGYNIDHCTQEYQNSTRINFNNTDLGYSQMLDTLIIKQIAENPEQTQWLDTADINGESHHVLKVQIQDGQQYKVYLNRKTGLLTRMLQQRGKQLRHYDFLDHKTRQGFTWAKQMYVSADKQPLYYTDAKEVTFNQTKADFKLPTRLQPKQALQPVDVSKLTIEQIAKGVFFVGQDWGYSLFIDVGAYYISVGAWHFEAHAQPYKRSLALLKETTGVDKPVKQHIVTHHHTDHMAALPEIVKSGASLVLHKPDISSVKAYIQQNSKQTLADEQIIPIRFEIDHTAYLAKGKVMLFDVPTSHASHNLMVYLPEHHILFSEDIFGSGYQNGFDSPNLWPVLDTYQRLKKLDKKLDQLGLKVEQYLSSHHKRILSQADIDVALTIQCPDKKQLRNTLFQEN